jgi:hypothetical protein
MKMCSLRRGHDRWAKEVHFFDQMPPGPTQVHSTHCVHHQGANCVASMTDSSQNSIASVQEYMECFSQEDQQAALSGRDDVVFLDATPAYFRIPAAAPRVQQALPHAKFVIILRVCFSFQSSVSSSSLYVTHGTHTSGQARHVLQDPVARYLSAYNMIRDNECRTESEMCHVPSFSMFATGEMSSNDLPEECFFNVDVSLPCTRYHAATARHMHCYRLCVVDLACYCLFEVVDVHCRTVHLSLL